MDIKQSWYYFGKGFLFYIYFHLIYDSSLRKDR